MGLIIITTLMLVVVTTDEQACDHLETTQVKKRAPVVHK